MKHIGNLEITAHNADQFTGLKEVTGYLYVYGSAKLDAPSLETVGGYLRVDGSAKLDALETVGGYLYVIVTQSKMIQAYRAITGACEFGVRNFCEGKSLPKKITVSDAIQLTKGQYGSESFGSFFREGV